MASNVREQIVFTNPKTLFERQQRAESCVRRLGIEFPALIDPIENTVEHAYTGWPDRLYVIDTRGKVAFKSAPGPFGFHPLAIRQALVSSL